VATSAIVSALTPLPPSPKQSILVNARDAAAPQEFVYGEVRKGGITTYYETTRGGSVLYQIIAVAAHEVESIDAIYVNDKQVTLSADGYDNGSRQGAGWVTDDEWTSDDTEHEIRIFYHTGNQTAITDTFANSSVETLDSVFFDTGNTEVDSQNFGGVGQPTKASFVGNGIAYIFVRYSFNAGVFSKGLPLITCKLKGKKVYDPRTTSTAYSNNAALCIRDYLTSAYGLNDPNIDDTVFSAAANTCDENVSLDAGGTEKRYTLNGVVRADQPYGDVLQQMITSCGGTLFWGGGKWKLGVGEYNAPTKVLTLDDLRSNISVQTRTNLRDQFNRVQGVFTDASNRYLVADYPPIESATFLAQDDGVEQTLDFDLPFTTSSATAQRLAKQTLFRGREQMVFSADFGLNAFDVEVGEIVALTVDRYGWTEKEFEVVGWNFNSSSEGGDLRVSLTLRETSSAAFDWNAEEIEVTNNDSTLEPPTATATVSIGTLSVQSINNPGGGLIPLLVFPISVTDEDLVEDYVYQWRENSIDYSGNGGFVELSGTPTAREQLVYDAYLDVLYRVPDQDGFDNYVSGAGSSLTDAQIRAQLAASPEGVNQAPFQSIVSITKQSEIRALQFGQYYDLRAVSRNPLGFTSAPATTTILIEEDTTAPPVPTFTGKSNTVLGKQITFRWNNPSTDGLGNPVYDLAYTEVFRNTSNTTSGAVRLGTSTTEEYIDTTPNASTTYWYFARAVDYTGNTSAFTSGRSSTSGAEPTDGVDGADGISSIQLTIFRRSTTSPSTPSGGSYNFDTSSLSAPSGWTDTVPTGTDPIYASTGKASILGDSGTDFSITWSTPRLFVQNGEDGDPGPKGDDGARGPGRWHVQASPFSLPTTSSSAQTVWNNNVGFAPVVDDQVWFYTGTLSNPTSQAVFICSSVTNAVTHTWVFQDEVIDGNLLVTGTVSADKIKLLGGGSITGDGSNNLIISSGGVGATELASGAVTSVKFANTVQSDDYSASTAGWQISRATGSAEFNEITARGTVRSNTFTSGSSGWEINSNGNAEFNNVTVRGTLDATNTTVSGTFDGPDAITQNTIVNAGDAYSNFGATGNGSFQNEVNVTVTFSGPTKVAIFWQLVQDFATAGANWGYRIREGGTTSSGGTTIDSYTGLADLSEHAGGVSLYSVSAGTYTFRFDSWGSSSNVNVDEIRLVVFGGY
jgi:hypothetical protein